MRNSKGISAVIATLLMLVITVAIAITAYGYVGGLFETTTSQSVELVDASCNTQTGKYFVTVRNSDLFSVVETNDILLRVDDVPVASNNIKWTVGDGSLEGYWNFNDGVGNNSTSTNSGGPTANFSGNVWGDFENTQDGFTLNCGGQPTVEFVPGKSGTAIKIYDTGGDGLGCMHKPMQHVTPGYTIWFYGRGYVSGLINDPASTGGNGVVSYIEEAATGCRTPNGVRDIVSNCNGGNQYSEWTLFKLVAFDQSVGSVTPRIWFYDQGGTGGEPDAGYYDYITDGPVWVDGNSSVYEKGLSFDGFDDVVMIPAIKPNSVTASLWLYPLDWVDQLDGSSSHHLYHGTDGIGIVSDNTNWVMWIRTASGRQTASFNHNDLLNQWYFLTLTYDEASGEMNSYLNGNLMDNRNLGAGTPIDWGAGGLLRISHVNWNTYGFIDNVKIYDRALTSEEVRAEYSAGSDEYVSANGGAGIAEISGISPGAHRIKIIGPSGRPQQLSVSC